jgi:DNA-binding XRE family transcriptional regulator
MATTYSSYLLKVGCPTVASSQPTPDVGNRLAEADRLPTSFGELLRTYRQRAGKTQSEAAHLVGVSRATFAQWETNRHLPSEENVHELDRHLSAGGALAEAAEQARPGPARLRPLERIEPAPPIGSRSVIQVLRDARLALLEQLCQDKQGRPTGWRHNLVPSDEPPSVVSTAYGLKTLAIHGGPDHRTAAAVSWVFDKAVVEDGRRIGWRSRQQVAPRMEITGSVLDALLRAGVEVPADEVVRMLDRLVDETTLARPTILSTTLEPLLRVAPEAELTTRLIRALLDCRVDFNGTLLWPEKRLHRDQPMLTASVAHTAHAVAVLRAAPDNLVKDALAMAEQWISEADDLNGVTEIIRRDLDADRREELTLHRFTSTWVARALAGAGVPDQRRIEHALGYVWERYDPGLNLWAWGNGDVPVWMLADAVAALHDAALALHTGPAPTGPR